MNCGKRCNTRRREPQGLPDVSGLLQKKNKPSNVM
jgi:hypothetical protein